VGKGNNKKITMQQYKIMQIKNQYSITAIYFVLGIIRNLEVKYTGECV
jgi:hypothetical protein